MKKPRTPQDRPAQTPGSARESIGRSQKIGKASQSTRNNAPYALDDMNMNPNTYDLEKLLQRSDFAGLSQAEQEFALREFGSAERYNCARTTLEHLPSALKFEEDMLELDPNLLVGINQRLDARARPWYMRAIDFVREATPSQMAYSSTGVAMLIFVGLTIGISGSNDFARDGLHLSADPADTLIEMFADSGNVQSSDVDVDDSLLSLRSTPVRQDLVYAARDLRTTLKSLSLQFECDADADLNSKSGASAIGLAASAQPSRVRRSFNLQPRAAQINTSSMRAASILRPAKRAGPAQSDVNRNLSVHNQHAHLA